MTRKDRRRFGIICGPIILRELALGFPPPVSLAGWNEPRPAHALQLHHAGSDASSSENVGSLALVKTRSPALLLPEDIVLAIFLVVVQTQPAGVVFTLASICRCWRSYALNYSGLWSLIDTGHPHGDLSVFSSDLPSPSGLVHRLKLQLARARQWPLHITVRSSAPESLAEIAYLLATAQSRWKTLTVHVKGVWGIEAFFRSCCGPSPLLQRLAIIVDSYAAPVAFSNALFMDALFPCNSLQVVNFVRCAPISRRVPGSDEISPIATSPPLPNATTLHIDVPPIAIRGQRWQRLLHEFPILEDFALTIRDVSPHPLGRISHPTVRRFSLDATTIGLTVLAHFHFPRLARFTLRLPLLELQSCPAARSALYGFLDSTPVPHLVFRWPEDDEYIDFAAAAFEEFCGVVFSTMDLRLLTVEFTGHTGPWLQLLQNFDRLTPDIASSLGTPQLQRIEMVFKSLHPWSQLPWLPLDDLVFVSEEFPNWEIVLQGDDGPGCGEAALWVAIEEPGRYFSQFSLSRWLIA